MVYLRQQGVALIVWAAVDIFIITQDMPAVHFFKFMFKKMDSKEM